MKFINQITGQEVEPTEWQLNLKVGDYYIIAPSQGSLDGDVFDGPTIYGQIVSNEECDAGFFYVRGYSQWCPDGELGLFNICDATRQLTEAEFNQARQDGWPDPEVPAMLTDELIGKIYYELDLIAYFLGEGEAFFKHNPNALLLLDGKLVVMPVENLEDGTTLEAIEDRLFAEVFVPHHEDKAAYGLTCHILNKLNYELAVAEAVYLKDAAGQIVTRYRDICRQEGVWCETCESLIPNSQLETQVENGRTRYFCPGCDSVLFNPES